jgi:hypothetical protein
MSIDGRSEPAEGKEIHRGARGRPKPQKRSSRGALSVDVRKPPSEAMLAEADVGLLAMRFVLVRSPPPAGAFEKRRESGSLKVKKASGLSQAIEIQTDVMEIQNFQKASRGFNRLPRASTSFQKLPKISAALGPGRRGGTAGRSLRPAERRSAGDG